ncbi:MAG: hypothetical protein M3O34_17250 [Chloroflexota bacterium]|nr:hypothetical protein [Chloroflexota bacterium]
MERSTPQRAESAWIAVFCTGVLIASLAATVCLGMLAFYAASHAIQPVLGCFATGAVLMIVAAARLDRVGAARTD